MINVYCFKLSLCKSLCSNRKLKHKQKINRNKRERRKGKRRVKDMELYLIKDTKYRRNTGSPVKESIMATALNMNSGKEIPPDVLLPEMGSFIDMTEVS